MSKVPILELTRAIAADGSEILAAVQAGTTVGLPSGLLMAGSARQSVQSANLVFAGPATGSAAAPTFRALVSADFTGTVWAIPQGGTGQITAPAAFDALAPTTTRGDLIYRNATTNTRLAASTFGFHLQTNGAATDPTWVGFVPDGASAVTRSWQDKAQDTISILDFIPIALHAGIRDGTGTTDLATYLGNARTYVGTLTYPCALVFPAGRYRTTVSPNWALSELSLVTVGEVFWDYTGTGNCFIVDGGASPANGVINMFIGKFIITGTSSALNGVYCRALIHCAFDGPNVRGCGTAYSGILAEFCVLTQWNKPTVSNNECAGGSFGTAKPANGMKLDTRGSGGKTAYCTIINPILEGVPVGMNIADTVGNTIYAGTMEGCTSQGLLLATTAVNNKIHDCCYESNTQDIYCAGDNNTFMDCDTQLTVIFDASAANNILKGGVHKGIVIQASATNNCVQFIRYNWDNSGATIADSGTTSRLFMNFNIGTAVWSGISTENIAANSVTYAKIQQGTALSVLGVAGNATADFAAIAAASDFQVMRRSGTAIAFGAVNLASSAAVTGSLALANGGTAGTDAATARTNLVVAEQLTAARTYYVRTDGSDSNTGLVNNAGGAFLTLQKAINTVYGLNCGGQAVTIAMQSGTFTGNGIITGPLPGGGTLAITGSTTVISTTSASCFVISAGASVTLSGLDLRTTTAGACLNVSSSSLVTLGASMIFGACAGVHVQSNTGCSVVFTANYTINGAATVHWSCSQGRIQALSLTITISGTPAFSTLFAYAEYCGCLIVFSNTFSGSATGTRYLAAKNGIIDTNGGGGTYLPGNGAGSTATGGQYI